MRSKRWIGFWLCLLLVGLGGCATAFESPCSYTFMLVPTQKEAMDAADALSQNRNLYFNCEETQT